MGLLCLVPDDCVEQLKVTEDAGYSLCLGFWSKERSGSEIIVISRLVTAKLYHATEFQTQLEVFRKKYNEEVGIVGICTGALLSAEELREVEAIESAAGMYVRLLVDDKGCSPSSVTSYLVNEKEHQATKLIDRDAMTSLLRSKGKKKTSLARGRSKSPTRSQGLSTQFDQGSQLLTTILYSSTKPLHIAQGSIPNCIRIAQQLKSSSDQTNSCPAVQRQGVQLWEWLALIISLQLLPFALCIQNTMNLIPKRHYWFSKYLFTISLTLGHVVYRAGRVVHIARVTWNRVASTYGRQDALELSSDESQALRRHALALVADYLLGTLGAFILAVRHQQIADIMYHYVGYALHSDNLRESVKFIMSQHAPMGFKLNSQLDTVLGTMVLLVVEVWHRATSPLADIAGSVMLWTAWVVLFGFCGISTFIAVAYDTVSFLVLHVKFMHNIFCNLHAGLFSAFVATLRLLLGKKYNTLRDRVDTGNYTFSQLLLGSMIFTVSVFLLQTTLAYYMMVVVLWLMVELVQRFILVCYFLVLSLVPADEIDQKVELGANNEGFKVDVLNRNNDGLPPTLLFTETPVSGARRLLQWLSLAVAHTFTSDGKHVVSAFKFVVLGLGNKLITFRQLQEKRIALLTTVLGVQDNST